MAKYILTRLLRGALSVIGVVTLVMLLVYTFMDRSLIFADDPLYNKQKLNDKTVYEQTQWEKYGYLDYISYADWLSERLSSGELDREEFDLAAKIGNREDGSDDTPTAARYIGAFEEALSSRGYTIVRLGAQMRPGGVRYKEGGMPRLFATRDLPLVNRLLRYFTGLIELDTTRYAKGDVGERGVRLTLHDPVYGGDRFSPALIGNGTKHKYLLYFDSHFPFLHQNLITLNLGLSYSVRRGVDVTDTMTDSQGSFRYGTVHYPTGLEAVSADDLHTAKYLAGSLFADETGFLRSRFTDDYTVVEARRVGLSRMEYSFVIGILSVVLSYLVGIPLGVWMARRRDGLVDRMGTAYIVFIIAVPSLAYIFLFKALGTALGFPGTFNPDATVGAWRYYVLPVISLALPLIASLMRWQRRYTVDQLSADYVKFARSEGLSERQIFRLHILRCAVIPIVHGIPASILGTLFGAIITERVYVVPGTGNLLTDAIGLYDNGVIVGITLFFAVLSVLSVLLGDLLLSLVDPRISLKNRKGD